METYAATIDATQFPSRVKHATIFAIWNALVDGATMLIVNDHDPKPLYYQLAAEYPGAFEWVYVENGPTCWRVALTKNTASKEGAAAER